MNLLSSLLKFTADKLGALISSTTSLGNRLTTAEGDIDSLEAQFTTVVSAVTTDTEVTNIRVGDDGVTYDTAGNAVRKQFANVKSDLFNYMDEEKMYLNPSFNLLNKYKITDGKFVGVDGTVYTGANYYYTDKIDVTNIEKVASPIGVRFITAYSGDTVVSASGVNHSSYDDAIVYTVPSGITDIVVSFNKTSAPVSSALLFEYSGVMVTASNAPTWRTIKRESLNDGSTSTNKMLISTVVGGNVFELDVNHIHKNKQINFYCEISGTFRDIRVGHGRRIYNGNYIELTATEYIVYGYQQTDIEIARGNHGLTITDFISISITCGVDKKASILVVTNGGTFALNNIEWTGNNGKPFVNWYSAETPLPTLSNGVLEFNSSDYSKPIYAFGDSYLNTWDSSRYPYYVKERGIDTWLIDGYPGCNSASAIESFRNVIAGGSPKYVLWLLGMNDPDDGSINASWKSCVDEVVAYCIAHNIEPILATIPCTPTMRNDRKNIYVKTLSNDYGYRFIDFAKAVGGESEGASWYNGFLSSDNVHPTAEGAKALANRLLLDFPEIINNSVI